MTVFSTVQSVKNQGDTHLYSAFDRGEQKWKIEIGPGWILILVVADLGSAGMYVQHFRKL